MATCKEQSSVAIYLRYIEMLKNNNFGRVITISNHDKHYEKLSANLEILENLGLPIEIFVRGIAKEKPVCIYKNTNHKFVNARQALQFGRKDSARNYKRVAKEELEYVLKELKIERL